MQSNDFQSNFKQISNNITFWMKFRNWIFQAEEEKLEFEAKVFSVQNDEVDGAAASGENDGDIGLSSSSQNRGRFLGKLDGHPLKK